MKKQGSNLTLDASVKTELRHISPINGGNYNEASDNCSVKLKEGGKEIDSSSFNANYRNDKASGTTDGRHAIPPRASSNGESIIGKNATGTDHRLPNIIIID